MIQLLHAITCFSILAGALTPLAAATARDTHKQTTQEPEQTNESGLMVGQRAPVSGVYFACGEWAKHSKMTCPAAARGSEPKIAIYAMALDEPVIALARAVDQCIGEDAALRWSFLSISDSKGGQEIQGSESNYTREQREQRLNELKQSAADNGIEHLTVGLTRNSATQERQKLKLGEEHNVVVAFLDRVDGSSRRVKFARSMRSADLTEQNIAELIGELQQLRPKAN